MEYYKSDKAKLYHGDCRDLLEQIPDDSIDCIITDPPYAEIDRDYGRLSESDWLDLMDKVISESKRVLKPSGSAVYILQPNSKHVGQMRPWLWRFMADQAENWNLIQDVYWWNYTACPTVHCSRKYGLMRPSVKYCIWLGEPDCYRNQDQILWRESDSSRATRLADRATHRLRYSPSGYSMRQARVNETVSERGGVTPLNLMPMPPGGGEHGSKYGHAAATPMPLADWWTRYICPPGGTILDPFCGSGTMGLVAINHECHFVGIEGMKKYVKVAAQRLAEIERQRVDIFG